MSFRVISPFSMVVNASNPYEAGKYLARQQIMLKNADMHRFIIQDMMNNNRYGGQITFYNNGQRQKAKINVFPTSAYNVNSVIFPTVSVMGRTLNGTSVGIYGPNGQLIPIINPAAPPAPPPAAPPATPPAATTPTNAPPAPSKPLPPVPPMPTPGTQATGTSPTIAFATPFGAVAAPVFGVTTPGPLLFPPTSMSSLSPLRYPAVPPPVRIVSGSVNPGVAVSSRLGLGGTLYTSQAPIFGRPF